MKNDALNNDEHPEIEERSDQRQRPDPQTEQPPAGERPQDDLPAGLTQSLALSMSEAVRVSRVEPQQVIPRRSARVEVRPTVTPPIGPATAGQSTWLASLDAGQRARFDMLPAKAQERLLAPHRDGPNADPIISAHAAKILSPRPTEVASPSLPKTTDELWARLPDGQADWPQRAAEALCRRFGTDVDRKLWSAFHQLAQAVWREEFPAAHVIDALRQSSNPKCRNPGAVFNHALQAHGWTGKSGRP